MLSIRCSHQMSCGPTNRRTPEVPLGQPLHEAEAAAQRTLQTLVLV